MDIKVNFENGGRLDFVRSGIGADPFGPISTKIGMVVGVNDVIIQSNFGFSILISVRSAGVEISVFLN